MKKKWIKSLISSVLIGVFTFSMVGCGSKTSSSKTQTVKLNEVVRSIFYAPMYVAINKGFFKEEGLKIELSTGQGADKTITYTQALILGESLPRFKLIFLR